jgi:hypothetical protein
MVMWTYFDTWHQEILQFYRQMFNSKDIRKTRRLKMFAIHFVKSFHNSNFKNPLILFIIKKMDISSVRLRSNRGGYILPDYELPDIPKELPKSIWSPLARNHYKKAIDVGEVMTFERNNVDAYEDRIIHSNITNIPYGINRGAGMSYTTMMNTNALPKNWSTLNAQNPQKALVDDYFRPVIRSSYEDFRAIGKAPNRIITREGIAYRDTSSAPNSTQDPLKLARATPYQRHDNVEAEGGIHSAASMVIGMQERPIPQLATKHSPVGEPDINAVGGENEFLDTLDTRSKVAVVAPTASYRYFQPDTAEWGTQNIAGVGHPKITSMITDVTPNASYKIVSMDRPVAEFKEAFRPKAEPITRGALPDVGVPERRVPDFVIREVEPITVHSNPVIVNNIQNVEVSDLMNGSRYVIRENIPHIVAESKFQLKVYDPQTRQYTPVHEKDNQRIIADAQKGKILNFTTEGSPNVHLKDYRMITVMAPGKIPMVAIIPQAQQVTGQVRERGSYGEGRLDRVAIPASRENIPATFRRKNGAIQA